MVKYFVKKHCEATELLCVSTGRVQDYYYGRNNFGGFICKNREPKSFEGTMYGLDTRAEAEELLAKMEPRAHAETAAGSWVTTLSIVEA